MADDIFKDLAKYKAPSKLPRISMLAYFLYEEAGDRMTADALEALRIELSEKADDLSALTDVNIGLGVFALYLRDTRKDVEGAEAVAALIRETAPQYQTVGERIVAALQDLAESASGLLDQFSDRQNPDKKNAPAFGDSAPDGTLPLKTLKPVGDLREQRALRGSKPETD